MILFINIHIINIKFTYIQILASFTCYDGENNINGGCKSSGRIIPEAAYNMARDYSEATQDLLDIYPELKSLTECKLVKQFSDVVLQQCKPIRVAIRWLWAMMLFLSISMVALVLIWVAKAFQDKGRSFSMCSINPIQHASIYIQVTRRKEKIFIIRKLENGIFFFYIDIVFFNKTKKECTLYIYIYIYTYICIFGCRLMYPMVVVRHLFNHGGEV